MIRLAIVDDHPLFWEGVAHTLAAQPDVEIVLVEPHAGRGFVRQLRGRDDVLPAQVERFDDAAVVQLYADGFVALPLDQKQLIYHLYLAAIAGRTLKPRPSANAGRSVSRPAMGLSTSLAFLAWSFFRSPCWSHL